MDGDKGGIKESIWEVLILSKEKKVSTAFLLPKVSCLNLRPNLLKPRDITINYKLWLVFHSVSGHLLGIVGTKKRLDTLGLPLAFFAKGVRKMVALRGELFMEKLRKNSLREFPIALPMEVMCVRPVVNLCTIVFRV